MKYLAWLAVFTWLPTLLIWLKNHQQLKKYPRTFLFSILAGLSFALPWDIIAVKQEIWHFPPENIIGIYFLSLPLEEYLFIIFETLFVASLTVALKTYVRAR